MKTLIVLVILVVLFAGCGMELTLKPEKVYARETETMEKIKEHQMLQLEILQINARINQFSTPRSAVPITPRPVVPVTPAQK